MPGILREVAEHSLNIKAGSKPVKLGLRRFDEERHKAIGEELQKLLVAGFIKEVYHPEWLANPVLVRKKNGKWRMCVDYTGLNKACPKDPFPLPRIDQIVDSTAGCETLSFLDAYSGYHQIAMKESDQLATSFITPFGPYCYVTMPFGLKNAGATFQRCMLKCFGDLIGRTVEAYVDDIVVKSRKSDQLIPDLELAFERLRDKHIKVNPEKCIFGVSR
ncbi:reverse transcriptase family protein, partial [Salmonella enterica]|nr:reverse transcriptase family protein [Salmonella enterica]